MATSDLVGLAVAAGLGLLVGLQRERTERALGGIRTFPLIALFGAVCAHLAEVFGGWILAAGLLALVACVVASSVVAMRSGATDAGMTTEIGALLLYGLGAYIVIGEMVPAVVVGGVVLLLLQLKQPMHAFARAVGEDDMRAVSQFVLVSLVILPVLPRRPFGPYGAWNPFQIWLMVTLIVAIGLVGYVAYRAIGGRGGPLVAGLVGGLMSSTAVTASYARRAAAGPSAAPMAALAIAAAASVSLARVLVELAIVAPRSFAAMAPPIAVLLALSAVVVVALFAALRDDPEAMPAQRNPAELGSALVFGALYALVLVAVAAARDLFGAAGLFAVASLSGLTDLDAITLSTAGLAEAGAIAAPTAWRAIVVAAMANLTFKLGLVAVLGRRALTGRIAAGFGALAAAGAAILRWWPG